MDDQPPRSSWVAVARSHGRKEADEQSLMLHAVGIPSWTVDVDAWTAVVVHASDAARARSEIAKYTRENEGWPAAGETPVPISQGIDAALAYALVLIVAYILEVRDGFGLDWWHAGIASAAMIRDGAWWRAVTSLFLHGDLLHLVGNLVFGVLFGVMLAQSVGAGLAWLAFVVTGGLGNWANAWLQSPSHASLGASTAIFGMLGVQVAYDWLQRRRLGYGLIRKLAPIAMGVALLAWLGGDGRHADPSELTRTIEDVNAALPRIDVGAHVLGFLSGLGAGALLGLRRGRLNLPFGAQVAIGSLAAGVAAVAWYLALR
jgi:membrane associated rhomboid family serine protease